MRVTHVSASNGGGGAGIAANRLHERLYKRGHDSEMLVDRDMTGGIGITKLKGKSDFIPRVRNRFGQVFVNMLSRDTSNIRSASILGSGIVRTINNRSGLVNLHWVQGEMMTIEEIGRITRPLIWTLHDGWPFCGAEHLVSESVRNRYRAGYNELSKGRFDLDRWCFERKLRWKIRGIAVAPSRWMAARAAESAVMRDWEIVCIPNIVEVKESLYMNQDKTEAREVFRVGCGSASHRDGKASMVEEVIEACLEASKETKRTIEVVRVGSASSRNYQISSRLRVREIERNSLETSDILSCCDCFVSASRLESFGLLVAEAQACGVPVVCWETSGLLDVVNSRETGFLIKGFDKSERIRKIIWLEENQDKAVLMGRNAAERAKKLWSPDVVSTEYERVYEKALEGYRINHRDC